MNAAMIDDWQIIKEIWLKESDPDVCQFLTDIVPICNEPQRHNLLSILKETDSEKRQLLLKKFTQSTLLEWEEVDKLLTSLWSVKK